jgi:hypothetical protein
MVLCGLVSDMVRLAAYDSRMHAVLVEAVVTRHNSEQGPAAAHLAAVPQHLPPQDLLQHAEDVAYHLQQQCSSNATSTSSPADALWRLAAEELAAALAHPGPHIRKVLDKLQQSTDLLTGACARSGTWLRNGTPILGISLCVSTSLHSEMRQLHCM